MTLLDGNSKRQNKAFALADIDRRLAWSFGGLIFTLMVLVLLAGGWYLRGIMEREQNRLATLTTQVLSNAVSRVSFSGKYQARLLLEEIRAQQPDILYLRLVDADGVVVAHSDPVQNDTVLDRETVASLSKVMAGHPRLLVRRIEQDGESLREVSLAYRGGYDNATLGVIQVGIAETARSQALRDGVGYIALLLCFMLLVGIVVTLRISAHFGNPVRQLAVTLEHERSYLRTLLGTIPDLVWMKSPQGAYLICNRAFEGLFGAREAEIVGKTDDDFVAPELAEQFRLNDQKAIAADQPTVNEEWVTFADSGKKIVLETIKTPMYDSDGRLLGVLGVGRDITEHRAVQDELARHRDHLEESVAERTSELLLAKRDAEAAHAETRTALDNLRRAQVELVRAEKIAGLGSLVAGVAHELNTPIGNAVMAASTLDDQARRFQAVMQGPLKRSTLIDYAETVSEASSILMRNLERAAQLITSFKQVAVDQTSYQRRRFELNEVVSEIALTMAPSLRRSRCVLTADISRGIILDSYPGPLGQILINLINNAIVHAFDPERGGEISIRAEQRGRRVEVRVADNGRGIAAEHLGRIFDPFFTTRLGRGGTGLGLNIVYNLATELLGGTIKVDSTVGAGTTFVLDLPLCAPLANIDNTGN